jgi:hypothetical protein
MKAVAIALLSVLFVAGCKKDAESDTTPPQPAATVAPKAAPAASASSKEGIQDPVGAEQSLRMMAVPIYPDAKIDTTQHSLSEENSANAVFTTSATTKQVDYFYNGYAELKSRSANGSTVFSGTINGVHMVIEIRPSGGKTQIILQGRRP